MATFEGTIKEIGEVKEFPSFKLMEIVVDNEEKKETGVFTAFDMGIDEVKKFKKGDKVEISYRFTARNNNSRWWLTCRIAGIEKAML